MTQKPRRSRSKPGARGRRRLGPMEIGLAVLGGLVVILVVGMIVSALVQGR